MTPESFLSDIVLPTVREFRAEPLSSRRAYLACIVAHHLGDYLQKAGEQNPRDHLRTNYAPAAVDVVSAVANGSKHADYGKDKTGAVKFRPGDEQVRGRGGFGSGPFGSGAFGVNDFGLEVFADGGSGRIMHAVETVIRSYVAAYPARFPNHRPNEI